MIFAVTESKAKKIFNKYPTSSIAAFSLDPTMKKCVTDKEIEINYQPCAFMPDADTINAVAEGHMKAKKVIKKAVNSLKDPTVNPKKKSMNKVAFGMGIVLNMIQDNADIPQSKTKKQMKRWEKNHAPNIVAFILPEIDETMDKKAAKRRNKFLVDYLQALFNYFDLYVLNEKKDIKKITKKLFNGKPKKNAVTVRRFIEAQDSGMLLTDKASDRFQVIKLFYSCEYLQLSLDNQRDLIKMDRSNAEKLARHLLSCFTSHNIMYMADVTSDKHMRKDIGPNLSKKNRLTVKYYNELNEIMQTLGDEFKMPKAVFGNTKKSLKKYYKSGKAKDLVTKMNTKKFMKYFGKSDNRPMMRLIYCHIVSRLLGLELGTNEYNRNMLDSISIDLPMDFAKTYVATAKKWAKARKEEEASKKAVAAEN